MIVYGVWSFVQGDLDSMQPEGLFHTREEAENFIQKLDGGEPGHRVCESEPEVMPVRSR